MFLQTVLDLLVLSDRYEFNSLKHYVETLLCGHMELNNVLQLMSYADMYSAAALHRQCTDYIDSNANRVLVSQSMLLIPKEHLKSLLRRDSFFASEIAIFEAVNRWKNFNGLKTEEIRDVLQCVRLGEISSSQLEGIVQPSGLYPMSKIEVALKENESPSSFLRQPRGKLGIKCRFHLQLPPRELF